MKNGTIVDLEALSQAIRRKRKAERLTFRGVAALLPGGLSASNVRAIEVERRMPRAATLDAVCQWLGAPPSRFVRGISVADRVRGRDGSQLLAIRAQIEAAPDLDLSSRRFLIELVEAGYRAFGV